MKAFLSSCVAAIAIAVVAWLVLDFAGLSSADVFSVGGTRL